VSHYRIVAVEHPQELKTALGDALNLAAGRERIASLRLAFGIGDVDLIAGSYGDLASSAAASKNSIGPERPT
jgi:hypothetical protein